jgi:hypothetical protein
MIQEAWDKVEEHIDFIYQQKMENQNDSLQHGSRDNP